MTAPLTARAIGALCILGNSVEYMNALPLVISGEPGYRHNFGVGDFMNVSVVSTRERPQELLIFVVRLQGKEQPSEYELCADAVVALTEYVEKLRGERRDLEYTRYVRELQRSLWQLIELAKGMGLNNNSHVNEAKELIRCARLECGLGGACDGVGSKRYPCPLKIGLPR